VIFYYIYIYMRACVYVYRKENTEKWSLFFLQFLCQYFFVLTVMQSSKFLKMHHTLRDICSKILYGMQFIIWHAS